MWEGAAKHRGPQDLDEGGSPSGRKSLSKHFLSWFLSVPGISADTLYAFLKKTSHSVKNTKINMARGQNRVRDYVIHNLCNFITQGPKIVTILIKVLVQLKRNVKF